MPNAYRSPIDPGYGSAALLIANGVRDALANAQAGRDRRFALAEHERQLAQQAEDRARAERDRTVTRRMAGVYPATRAPSTPFAASVALRGNPAAGAAPLIADAVARTMPSTRSVAQDPALRNMAQYDLGEGEVYVPEASADMIEARERTRAALAQRQEAEAAETRRKAGDMEAAFRAAGAPEAEIPGLVRQALVRPNLLNEYVDQRAERAIFDALTPEQRRALGNAGTTFVPGYKYGDFHRSYTGREHGQQNTIEVRGMFGSGGGDGEGGGRAEGRYQRERAVSAARRLFREGKTAAQVTNYLADRSRGFRSALSTEDLRAIASEAEADVRRERDGSSGRTGTGRPPAPAGAQPRAGAQPTRAAQPPARTGANPPARGADTRQPVTRDQRDYLLAPKPRGAGLSRAEFDRRYRLSQ